MTFVVKQCLRRPVLLFNREASNWRSFQLDIRLPEKHFTTEGNKRTSILNFLIVFKNFILWVLSNTSLNLIVWISIWWCSNIASFLVIVCKVFGNVNSNELMNFNGLKRAKEKPNVIQWYNTELPCWYLMTENQIKMIRPTGGVKCTNLASRSNQITLVSIWTANILSR